MRAVLNVPKGKKPKAKAPAVHKVSKISKPAVKASTPGSDKKGNKAQTAINALNPPFDPRMRSIGSPLNLTQRIKRGWIQDEKNGNRVNFLLNPSELDLSHNIDPSNVRQDSQAPPDDVTDPWYTGTGSSTGVKLLYDRTYELFSAGAGGKLGFANTYGVWADVAAWYTYLGMLDKMPTNWQNSMIVKPAQLRTSYLYVGSKLVYYGWVTGLNVTYSHFTQTMVPQRCSVDVGFQILPHTGANPVMLGDQIAVTGVEDSWLTDWLLPSVKAN